MKKLFALIVFIVGGLNTYAQTTLIPVEALKEMMLCTTVDCIKGPLETYGYTFDRTESRVNHYFKSTETEGPLKDSHVLFIYDKLNKIRNIQMKFYDKAAMDPYVQLVLDAGYHAIKNTRKLSFSYYKDKDKKYFFDASTVTMKKTGETFYSFCIFFQNMY